MFCNVLDSVNLLLVELSVLSNISKVTVSDLDLNEMVSAHPYKTNPLQITVSFHAVCFATGCKKKKETP